MRNPIRMGLLGGLLALVILAALGARAGVWTLDVPRPAGTWAWTASRAAGVTAYLALTLDVLFGLFLSTAVADRWIARARSVEIHRYLSAVALTLTVAHAVVLLGDAYIGFDLFDVMLPGAADFRRTAVGLGIVSLWIGFAVHASFRFRNRIGARVWRVMHYASFGTFALATAHGLQAGSDSHAPWMMSFYIAAVAGVVVLTGLRVAGRGRRPNAAKVATSM